MAAPYDTLRVPPPRCGPIAPGRCACGLDFRTDSAGEPVHKELITHALDEHLYGRERADELMLGRFAVMAAITRGAKLPDDLRGECGA